METLEQEAPRRGRPKKNPDEVLTNADLQDQPVDLRDQTIISMQAQLETASAMQQLLLDRLSRLEAVSDKNKMRKWDESNDPVSLMKEGAVPSLDGKDPIVSITRSGNVTLLENGAIRDEQVITVKTHGGEEKKFTLMDFNSACTGNSIPCRVNDWDSFMAKQKVLFEKRQKFQQSTGQGARSNTVALLNEIKDMEKNMTINVTLSEDYGKTFEGLVLDIPHSSVFNAIR